MREAVMMVATGDNWQRLGGVAEVEPPGSFSDLTNGREVYVFGWLNGDGPGVWRSEAGADITDAMYREIASTGYAKIADLDNGSHEMTVTTPSGHQARLLFLAVPGWRLGQ